VYIRTSGKPSKAHIKLCKNAVKFFGRKLLGDTLYHRVSLKLIFENFNNNKEYAYCEWEYDNHRSKDFIITVNKDLNKKQTLLAIAHEMVHVKQYAKGELKDYLRADKTRWKSEVHDLKKIDYWDQPWEIEAHGREKGLYYKFLKYEKENR